VQIIATHLRTRNVPSMRMLKTVDKKHRYNTTKNIFSLQLYFTPLLQLLIIIDVVLPISPTSNDIPTIVRVQYISTSKGSDYHNNYVDVFILHVLYNWLRIKIMCTFILWTFYNIIIIPMILLYPLSTIFLHVSLLIINVVMHFVWNISEIMFYVFLFT